MGLRAGLDRCGKSRSTPGFDPRTVQHVASRGTDWTILIVKETYPGNVVLVFSVTCRDPGPLMLSYRPQ